MNQLVIGAAVVAIFTLLLSIFRAREGIRHKLRRVTICVIVYVAASVVLVNVQHLTPVAGAFVGVVAAVIINNIIPARSRYIPQPIRRKKISEWERKHGQKFNAREYELDHHVPFSRGGSSTSDNLRIRSRRANRSKGAKRPWWYWG
ncbi:MAG: HNH endonuclease domain-containing protein [Terriglobales bacterium]